MKVITTNLLNRFYKNGVKPIKDALTGKLDASKIANNLTTTVAGYGLDARQGKALDERISGLHSEIGTNYVKNANGLLIQWGTSIHGKYITVTSNVNLPIPYKSVDYRIIVSPGRNGNLVNEFWVGDTGGNNKRTERSFNISSIAKNANYEKDFEWITIGKWK